MRHNDSHLCREVEEHHKGEEYEVDYENRKSSPESKDVATSNALAKEDAVVIVILDTDFTVFTVVIVSVHVEITVATELVVRSLLAFIVVN